MQSECLEPQCPTNKKKKSARVNASKALIELTDVLKVLLERVDSLVCLPERVECLINSLSELKRHKSYQIVVSEECLRDEEEEANRKTEDEYKECSSIQVIPEIDKKCEESASLDIVMV